MDTPKTFGIKQWNFIRQVITIKKELAELLSLGYAPIRRWCDRYDETGNCLIIKPVKEGRCIIFTDNQAILDYLQTKYNHYRY